MMQPKRHKSSWSRPFSRRTLLKGAAATGVAVAAVQLVSGCSSEDEKQAGNPTVVDDGSATSILDTYSEADLALTASASWELPLGSVLFAAEGSWLPVLAAGNTATQMIKGSALSIESGTLVDVVPECISEGSGWVVYDARCSDSVYAWVELDMLTRSWVLYATALSEGAAQGSPSKLAEGNSDYDPPQIACSADHVIWLNMPSVKGSKSQDHSFCYFWTLGGSDATSVVESPGRFGCAPSVSGSTVTLAPRVRADEGTYYGITAYDLSDNLSSVVDQLVLPASVHPFYATRIGDSFVFSIEANYGSGGLLGNMGTYIGAGQGPFISLAREPSAQVAGTSSGLYLIKSNASYFAVNTEDQTYSVLTANDRALDYGEYPASDGECSRFVTFSTVKDENTGLPASVVVRVFPLATETG